MWRVSSTVSVRVAPAGDNLPLISTSGGRPGEKNKSLIFGEVFSIAASSAGVENGAEPRAAAAPAEDDDPAVAVSGALPGGEDIEDLPFEEKPGWLESTDFAAGKERYGRH
jgi:hypothetical protein